MAPFLQKDHLAEWLVNLGHALDRLLYRGGRLRSVQKAFCY